MDGTFLFPPLPGTSDQPAWTGRGFSVNGRMLPLLTYEIGESGWTEQLTSFHEQAAGDGHFIDVASRRFAVSALARWLPAGPATIMDVGCSSGFLLRDLRSRFPEAYVLGADYVRTPLAHLARSMPDVPLLHFDLTRCPLPGGCLDAVVLLNVLEHVENDLEGVRQANRILKRNGLAVIQAPAGQGLYDVYDEYLMHVRRYSMRGLVALLRQAGFRILDRNYSGCFFYPAFWYVKKRNKRYLRAPRHVQERVVSAAIRASGGHKPWMHRLMRLEQSLGRVIRYPFGARCNVVCQKIA